MKIERVTARWLRVPLPPEQQHVSDFGRHSTFDAVLATIRTDDGLEGVGEAKSAVGSSGDGGTLVRVIEKELGPRLLGLDPRRITHAWETLYNGSRAGYARRHGRTFPTLGRRGVSVAALSAIDIALWDLLGKRLRVPVVEVLGGACRDSMPCYASGGWADENGIGNELQMYVDRGFGSVKMRVGAMDGSVARSIERTQRAREHLGPDVALMVDAHGTFSVAEAKRFARATESCGLRWFEEPVGPDVRAGLLDVRAATSTPIAWGESESTRFDFVELLSQRAIDVLQPDPAIVGGITEARRVGELAAAHQVELAPHLWGSAVSFAAGLHVAFACPAASILEVSLGANPLLRELAEESFEPRDGTLEAPRAPGLGVTLKRDFLDEYTCRAS